MLCDPLALGLLLSHDAYYNISEDLWCSFPSILCMWQYSNLFFVRCLSSAIFFPFVRPSLFQLALRYINKMKEKKFVQLKYCCFSWVNYYINLNVVDVAFFRLTNNFSPLYIDFKRSQPPRCVYVCSSVRVHINWGSYQMRANTHTKWTVTMWTIPNGWRWRMDEKRWILVLMRTELMIIMNKAQMNKPRETEKYKTRIGKRERARVFRSGQISILILSKTDLYCEWVRAREKKNGKRGINHEKKKRIHQIRHTHTQDTYTNTKQMK